MASAAVLIAVVAVAACGDQTASTITTVDPSPATGAEPSVATSTSTPAAKAPSSDPFDRYYDIVGPAEPALSKQQVRTKYDEAVKLFCPAGRAAMLNLKRVASISAGRSDQEQRTANEEAASAIGALWEFGCGKGHDADLYTPSAVDVFSGMPPTTDTGRRDANGETKEQYCARTRQPIDKCQAG
jgi:hypothetical protein